MKAIIWIIVVLLVAWGVWKWMGNDSAEDAQPAAAVEGLNYDASADVEVQADDSTPVEEKG